MCVSVCVSGFAAVILYKYTVHIFSPGCRWGRVGKLGNQVSLSLTHTRTYKFHPASRSYHKYHTHSHTAAIRWLWLRLLCPLRLYRMFDLFWLSEQAASSRPRLLHYSKYQIPASAITTRTALSNVQPVCVCVCVCVCVRVQSVLGERKSWWFSCSFVWKSCGLGGYRGSLTGDDLEPAHQL